MATDTVWIPAVPLPFLGRRTDTCHCGAKFRGKRRRHAYEIHYRRAHQRAAWPTHSDTPASETVLMEITRADAKSLYAEVNADLPIAQPERT